MKKATYPVAEIFKSIQGEGHFVGYPSVFVRLGGCSVTDCHIRKECDTDWSIRERLSAGEIGARVSTLAASGIVSITGGEPSDHDLRPLVDVLSQDLRFRVHLETSGKRDLAGLPVEWLTVSPKTPGFKQRVGHTLKVVVRPEWSWHHVRQLDQGTHFFHRYLQPMTDPVSGQPVNIAQVAEMVTSSDNAGGRWALSFQAHRAWGLR